MHPPKSGRARDAMRAMPTSAWACVQLFDFTRSTSQTGTPPRADHQILQTHNSTIAHFTIQDHWIAMFAVRATGERGRQKNPPVWDKNRSAAVKKVMTSEQTPTHPKRSPRVPRCSIALRVFAHKPPVFIAIAPISRSKPGARIDLRLRAPVSLEKTRNRPFAFGAPRGYHQSIPPDCLRSRHTHL
jgi:hypothetical protein